MGIYIANGIKNILTGFPTDDVTEKILVAERKSDGKIVGLLHYQLNLAQREGEIHQVSAFPPGNKYGATIITKAENQIYKSGCTKVCIISLPGAERFWEKRGYRPRPDDEHHRTLGWFRRFWHGKKKLVR